MTITWRSTVLDCPDPRALADFYAGLLELDRLQDDDDWVSIGQPGSPPKLAFQRAHDHVSPTWPDPAVPQQLHLDLAVDAADLEAAEQTVLRLGGRRLGGGGDGEDFRVYADPVGHPFCLVF